MRFIGSLFNNLMASRIVKKLDKYVDFKHYWETDDDGTNVLIIVIRAKIEKS